MAGRMVARIGQNVGGYLLEEELGRDSVGVIYRGKQLTLGREVIIKVSGYSRSHSPALSARFLRQAHMLAQLNHPNIVQIYDAGQHEGEQFLILESIRGVSIRDLLNIDGRLPLHLAVLYAAQVADALEFAYREYSIIHRDITPEHIVLDWRGHVKVTDFGLTGLSGQPQITTVASLISTFLYASPEQIQGKPLDNRSDIYALGIVLYEMVTGIHPFKDRTLTELTQGIATSRFPPPSVLVPTILPMLEYIIVTAMATGRDERFAHAGLLADALRALPLSFSPPDSENVFHAESLSGESEAAEEKSDASPTYTPLIKSWLTLPMRKTPAPRQ